MHLGGRTIKVGEAAVIWNNQGVARQVIGPQRVTLWYSTIHFLTRYKAESYSYPKVRHRDGRVDHIHGLVSMHSNPAVHDAIQIME